MAADVEVSNNTDKHQFEVSLDGGTAFAEYRLVDHGIILPHTVVPPAHEGKGVGSALAKAALGYAREQGLKVIEAGRRVAATVAELAATAGSAGELVRAHAALLAGWMAASGYRDGSPMTTVLLENAPADAPITAAGAAAFAAWRAILRERLVADGFPAERAERLAGLAIAALDGALVQARVAQDGAPLLTAAEEFEALITAARRQSTVASKGSADL